jgi:hypothetical protein
MRYVFIWVFPDILDTLYNSHGIPICKNRDSVVLEVRLWKLNQTQIRQHTTSPFVILYFESYLRWVVFFGILYRQLFCKYVE